MAYGVPTAAPTPTIDASVVRRHQRIGSAGQAEIHDFKAAAR